MILISKFLIGLVLHFIINKIFLKYELLLDDPNYSSHKKFINKSNHIILSGGTVFFLLFLFFSDISINFKIFIFLIFTIGIISDLKILNLPSIRLLFQFLVTTIFVYLMDMGIYFTDLKYLDLILDYKFFGILFSVLCFLVLINGSNFLDGLNTLVIGYYILVLLSLVFLTNFFNINYDLVFVLNSITILLVLLVFNFFNKSFIGDAGAYSISCLVGFVCIDFYKNTQEFSALFIVVILWYPAFETLFSIIRKITSKYSPAFADNKHLHHYLFIFIYSKFKKNYFSNIFAANLINIYNLLIFCLAISSYKNSYLLFLILLANIMTYICLYNVLKNER